GKRKLTPKSINKLGIRLGLNSSQLKSYYSNIKNSHSGELHTTSSDAPASVVPEVEPTFHLLDEDAFLAVQDWYHDAILELVKTKNFKSDFNWVANKLSLPVVQIRDAVERLQKLNLLKIHKNGRWENEWADNTTQLTELNTSTALREYQKILLEKSLAALLLLPIEERMNSSLMVAINSADLPKIRELVKKFRRDLNKFVSKDEATLNKVYAFMISGFPIC
ncbi:MAG: DUF4423 domain-containing protein, partial [Bdellovibrionales bacterium]